MRYKVDGATTFVVFCDVQNAARAAPYSIINRTTLPIVVRQKGTLLRALYCRDLTAANQGCASWLSDVVPPRSSLPYAWDEPIVFSERRIVAQLPGTDAVREFALDSMSRHRPVPIQLAGDAKVRLYCFSIVFF